MLSYNCSQRLVLQWSWICHNIFAASSQFFVTLAEYCRAIVILVHLLAIMLKIDIAAERFVIQKPSVL